MNTEHRGGTHPHLGVMQSFTGDPELSQRSMLFFLKPICFMLLFIDPDNQNGFNLKQGCKSKMYPKAGNKLNPYNLFPSRILATVKADGNSI